MTYADTTKVYDCLWYDVPQTIEQLAERTGYTTADVEEALQELAANHFAKRRKLEPDGPDRWRRGTGIA